LVEEQQPRVGRHRAGDLEAPPIRVREAVSGLVVTVTGKPLAEERELLFGELANSLLLPPRPRKLQHRLEDGRLRVSVLGGADDLSLVDVQVQMVDHLQTAEGLRDVAKLEQLRHGQMISTRDVPKIPDGRTFMITTSSAPSRIRRVAPDTCSTSLFSQTNDAR